MEKNKLEGKDARISVVDDDASMREAINTLISSIGLRVDEFLSAEDFLRSDQIQEFDCLILDIRMPGLDGLELQRRLIAANIKIPIVFVTAHYNENQRKIAMEAGAVAFLRKPFTEQELVNAIDASLVIRNRNVYGVDEDPD